jgi:trk system potassium uptake protein
MASASAAGRRPGRAVVIDLRPVLFLVGWFLAALAAIMLVPALADAAAGNPDWATFLTSSLLTLFVGVSLALATRQHGQIALARRQAFLLTSAVWVAAAAFGALPFALAEGLGLSYTDGFFEAMSGITTTGSTVMVGLDGAPPGILLWRALLQWVGGVGFIAIGVAVLPALRIGGMQLFQTESSDRSEKIVPRVAQLAGAILTAYVGLTALCAAAYGLAGMGGFDAVTHAMTTLATGGYANYDASFAHFRNPAAEWVGVAFMTAGGLPFVLYLRAARGDAGALWRDSQVRWYLGTLLVASLAVAVWIGATQAMLPGEALRAAAFNVVSVVTTTGYASADYATWGTFAAVAFFFLLFAGACTGSTSGGIKQFRYAVLYEEAVVQLRRLMQPHGAFLPLFNGRPIPEAVAVAVLAFFFLFALCTVALTVALSLCGLDFVTSLSGAATVLNNVGPGLGTEIGPSGNFAGLPDAAKWLLAFGMLLGRLELFTILVLLVPSFWRG